MSGDIVPNMVGYCTIFMHLFGKFFICVHLFSAYRIFKLILFLNYGILIGFLLT